MPRDLIAYKLFEVVEGAVIQARSEPGAEGPYRIFSRGVVRRVEVPSGAVLRGEVVPVPGG